MKFILFFIAVIIIFYMFLVLLELSPPKTIQAQKPCCFEIQEAKIKLIHDQENNYHNIDSQATINLESNYSKYLAATVDKSINLTKTYQDEIALWDHQNFSNMVMAKITETFLPKFVTQLNQFNNTEVTYKI